MANQRRNTHNKGQGEDLKNEKRPYRGKQGRKDSSKKRINLDNERKSKFEKAIAEGMFTKGANSIETYNKNPELLKAAGSIPFASILGSKHPFQNSISVPGIMTIHWMPNYVDAGNEEVVNQASNSMYSYVVHANSRNYSGTHPDYLLYSIAGIEVFCAIKEIARIYGVVKYYNERNFYLPDALVRALGFDPDDIRSNLPDIWYTIDNWIKQTHQIWVPNIFPLLQHFIERDENVYTDANGIRSQLYAFVRAGFYMLDETTMETGTSLVPAVYNTGGVIGGSQQTYTNELSGKLYTWAEYKTLVQNMINALIQSEDRGLIYGDLLKAYGSDKIYAMSEMTSDYIVTPIYNAEILMQIENAQVSTRHATKIVQMDDLIYPMYSSAIFQIPGSTKSYTCVLPKETVLNIHKADQPTPEEIMLMTRFKPGYRSVWNVLPLNTLDSTGAPTSTPNTNPQPKDLISASVTVGRGLEIVLQIGIHFTRSGGTGILQTRVALPVGNVVGSGFILGQSSTNFDAATLIQAFDWHPFLYFSPITTKVSSDNFYQKDNIGAALDYATGDFDNYTVLDSKILEKLNNVALYSAYGVPHM